LLWNIDVPQDRLGEYGLLRPVPQVPRDEVFETVMRFLERLR
jgi:hypothetical protein